MQSITYGTEKAINKALKQTHFRLNQCMIIKLQNEETASVPPPTQPTTDNICMVVLNWILIPE